MQETLAFPAQSLFFPCHCLKKIILLDDLEIILLDDLEVKYYLIKEENDK